MEVLERAKELEAKGESVIHMELGEPDFPTPACIQEAAQRALQEGKTKYTHSQGIRELREAITEHYQTRYGVPIHPEQVLVTAGTSVAMWLLFSALLEHGDEVIMSDPHYACYPNFVAFAGGQPIRVPVVAEAGFELDAEAVRAHLGPLTRAVLVNSPANPTGAVLGRAGLQALATLGPLIVSDEIYHGLTYEGEEHTILEFTDRAVVLNGFSKAYAMTGWRLGYLILPRPLVRSLQKMHQNFLISASDFGQWAAVAALRDAGSDVALMRGIYDERRRAVVQGLRALGLGIPREPRGAFYVLADARGMDGDSYRLAFDILERAKVAVTPGIDFGPGGEGYLRFSYANSLEALSEGMRRLGVYLAERRGGGGA